MTFPVHFLFTNMSSLSDACDDLLGLGILEHEHGIPNIWQKSSEIQKSGLEEEYYRLNQELATEVNKLVQLNKLQELRKLSAPEIEELYEAIEDDEQLQNLTQLELEEFLTTHTNNFKTQALMNEYLTMSLPVLRAIYHGNALTESEFSVLNNLKKLYSHYNEHPANINRLLLNYKNHQGLVAEHAAVSAELNMFLASTVTEQMLQLKELNEEYLVLQNTYRNQIEAHSESSRAPEQRRIVLAVGTLSRRITSVAVLCDFLPNLILCQATNWYNDKTLKAIVEDCQEISEKLPALSTRKRLEMDEILEMDFDEVAEQIV